MKKLSKKKWIVLIVCALLLLAIGTLAVIALDISRDISGKKLDEDASAIYIEVKSGATTRSIASSLEANGIIRYPKIFVFMATVRSVDTKLHVGSYSFRPGEKYETILEALKKAPPARPSVTITFPEGAEVTDIISKFLEKGIGTQAGFNEAVNADFGYSYLPAPGTEHRLEGFLYPDTYDFYLDDTEKNVLAKMLANFDAKAKEAGLEEKVAQSGMSFYEVVTLGSIVQKEGGKVSDFAMISSVFHNRLKIDMKLQSDATVSYVIPRSERLPSCTNQQLQTDTPYNVYLRKGLPPTPICCCSMDAIVAAAQPAESEYLFFIGIPTGETIFAVTYDEHQKNIQKYLK